MLNTLYSSSLSHNTSIFTIYNSVKIFPPTQKKKKKKKKVKVKLYVPNSSGTLVTRFKRLATETIIVSKR